MDVSSRWSLFPLLWASVSTTSVITFQIALKNCANSRTHYNTNWALIHTAVILGENWRCFICERVAAKVFGHGGAQDSNPNSSLTYFYRSLATCKISACLARLQTITNPNRISPQSALLFILVPPALSSSLEDRRTRGSAMSLLCRKNYTIR